MNYTTLMNYFSVRPLQAKNRSRTPSVSRAATGVDSGKVAGIEQRGATSTTSLTGQAPRHSGGVKALASVPSEFERELSSKPRLFLRKRGRFRSKLQLGRPNGESLELLVERLIQEKLAQRLPAPSEAVTAARERGSNWAREEYANPANLTLEQAADQVGVSARIINERRNDGRYYAILPPGQQRGFRFPVWQFDAPTDRVSAILAITNAAQANGWGVHLFMISPSNHLQGAAPRDWIASPTRDLEPVLALARARFTSDQGAG